MKKPTENKPRLIQPGQKLAAKPAKMRARAVVHMRVTHAQKERIQEAAKKQGQTVTGYLLEGKI